MVFDTKLFLKRIQAFPEIFDTNNPGFKQVDDKNGAWEKIAEEFKVDANFCRKRFRTLRERFTRELRKSYLEPTGTVKYEFFKELTFLTPYIKFRSISFESSDGKTIVTSKREVVDKDQTEELKLLEHEGYFTEEQEQESEHTYLQESAGSQNIIYESATIEHVPEFSGSSIHGVVQQPDEDHLLKENDRKRRYDNWDDVEDQDDNKYFAMSVACSLKRLSTLNNLKAKVEIFQVLEKFSSREILDKK